MAKRCFGSVFCLFFLCVLTGFGIDRYDRDASEYKLYYEDVYGAKRCALIAVLVNALFPFFFGQLKNLQQSCLKGFKTDLLEKLLDYYSFDHAFSNGEKTWEDAFTTGAEEALVEDTDWSSSWKKHLDDLKKDFKDVSVQYRYKEKWVIYRASNRVWKLISKDEVLPVVAGVGTVVMAPVVGVGMLVASPVAVVVALGVYIWRSRS
jgi:Root hair defective 3 GTP-binding protein (RHD3)